MTDIEKKLKELAYLQEALGQISGAMSWLPTVGNSLTINKHSELEDILWELRNHFDQEVYELIEQYKFKV